MIARKVNMIVLLFVAILSSNKLYGQFGDSDLGISASYNISTSARLFLFPNAKDEILRNQNIKLSSSRSYSIEVRYKISRPLIIGLSAEYWENKTAHNRLTIGGFRLDIDDGFKLIPIELSLYYHLPFSTEKFKFYMGGGLGVYFGEHIREFSTIGITDNGSESDYGIHVSVGLDYFANEYISLRGEMKFRDPEIDLKSKYTSTVFEHQGRSLLLSRDTFETKGNLDGITFSVGVVFRPF